MEVAFSPKPALHLNVIDGSLCWNSSKKRYCESENKVKSWAKWEIKQRWSPALSRGNNTSTLQNLEKWMKTDEKANGTMF